MADESINQSLSEFIQSCIDDLGSGSLTPEEAYVKMQQYGPLRDTLKDQNEITRDILLQVLTKELPLAGKRAEALDQPMSPAEIASRAQVFAKVQEQIPQAARQRFEQERKTYARRVASAWVVELRNRRLYNVTPQEEQSILQTAENLQPTTRAAETKNLVTTQLQSLAQANPNLSRGQEVLAQIAQATELAEPTQIQQQIFKTILDHPDTDQSMLLGLAAQGVDFQRAAQLADLGKVFSADIDPAITLPITDNYGRPIFFRAIAKTPFQKIVAPIADTIFTVVPPDKRGDVLKELFSGSLDRVTQKLGAAVVEQPLYKQAIDQANRAFTGRPSYPGGIVTGVGKIIADVGNSVFGSALDPEIFQLIEVEKQITITQRLAWDWRHGYAGIIHTQGSSPFSFAFEGGKWIFGFAGKKVVGAAVKGVAAKLSGTAIGAAIGSIIPGAGTIAGAALGFLGGKVFGGIKSLLGGLLGRRRDEEVPWWKNELIVGPLFLIVAIVLLFVAPLPTNSQFIGHMSQSSALADTEGPSFPEEPGITLESIASGSCPIEGGVITTGSLNRSANTGHGSARYWGGRTPSYPIPIQAMTPSCEGFSCPYYGFATDVTARGAIVRVPKICPKDGALCGDLAWTVRRGWFNCAGQNVASSDQCSGPGWGYGYVLTSVGNGHSWQIYLNHIIPRQGLTIGSTFASGSNNVVGSLSSTLSSPHVHVELNIDGIPVRPESVMCGT